MSIETDIFPVDGDTLRRWTFQDASGGAVDDSINAEPLDSVNGTPAYQQQGYGDAVKSDGDDDGIQFVATEYIEESNNNVTNQNITNMSVEMIITNAAWMTQNAWYGYFDNATGTFVSGGFALYGNRNTNGHRFLVSDQANGAYKYAHITEASFGASAGDWVYLCGVYDNGEAGDDKLELYMGNLTSPTANVTTKTGTSDDATGFVSMTAINTTLRCGDAVHASIVPLADGIISSGRIQGVAFSLATVEQRYDDAKTWVAALKAINNGSLSGGDMLAMLGALKTGGGM